MSRPRIKSRTVVASSRNVRANWVRTADGLFPKVKKMFNYTNGVNLTPTQ